MINFTALFSNLNIPKLRTLAHTAWLNILSTPLVLIQDWFTKRVNGYVYPTFNNATNYSVNAYVLYGRASYVCILTPSTGLNPLPTNIIYWYKILDDYIGLNERSHYSAQKVMFEFALNRRFSPTTITPPFGSTIPSIYIVTNFSSPVILWSAPAGTDTFTYVAPNSSISFWYSMLGNPTITPFYNFTIYVPSAVISATAPTVSEAFYIITQEANRYNMAGLTFNIIQY